MYKGSMSEINSCYAAIYQGTPRSPAQNMFLDDNDDDIAYFTVR